MVVAESIKYNIFRRLTGTSGWDNLPLSQSNAGGSIVQPLSYQSAEHSCWVACMVNGIRLVTDSDRVGTPEYRQLHSLLQDEGVPCYEPAELEAFDSVIEEVSNITELHIYRSCGNDVENMLLGLQFNRCVVVCDIGNGDHSILLHNRMDDWFEGFDPYWYEEERCGNQLLKFPKGNPTVNVKIRKRHLFSRSVDANAYGNGEEYHMGGIGRRFLTIIRAV